MFAVEPVNCSSKFASINASLQLTDSIALTIDTLKAVSEIRTAIINNLVSDTKSIDGIVNNLNSDAKSALMA